MKNGIKYGALGCGIVVLIGVLLVGGFIVSNVAWFAGQTVQVAKEEFGPRRLLQKYEWFKNQLAALDSMRAKIGVAEAIIEQIRKDYPDLSKAPRDVRQDLALARQEVAGLKYQYNNVAQEYNANMAKFNYAFCNAGAMPKGLEDADPLPREVAPYIVN